VDVGGDNVKWFPDDRVEAEGHVKAVFRRYTITSDKAEINLKTNVAVFTGTVRLTSAGENVTGENLTFNIKTHDWSVEKTSSIIQPSALQGQVTTPVFIKADSLTGSNSVFRIDNGSFTTCDKEHPDYSFRAKELEIYPGDKIVAHKVSVYARDSRLITLETIVVPINSAWNPSMIPQFGQSADEGTYLKLAYPYLANQEQTGFVKLDLMSAKGIGTGIDHAYKFDTGQGHLTLDYLNDNSLGLQGITGRLQHQEDFGTIKFNLTTDYLANNYLYYPGTTTENWQLGLTNMTAVSKTSLSYNLNTNSGSGAYSNSLTSFRQLQQLSPTMSANLSMDLRTNDAGLGFGVERDLDTTLDLNNRGDKYDVGMTISKSNNLEAPTLGYFPTYLDRLPEIRVSTDTYRFAPDLFSGVGFKLGFSAGQYYEETAGLAPVTGNRLLFTMDMMNKTFSLNDMNDLNVTAGYSQAYYAEDMEQYVARVGGILTSRWGSKLKNRLMYGYQDTEGFSPFRFDYTGKYHYIRTVLDYQDSKALRISFSGGYNLSQTSYNWQDLTLLMTARPSDWFTFSASTGFDPNQAVWRNLLNRIQFGKPSGDYIDIGTRYDLTQGQLIQVNGKFGIGLLRNYRLETVAGWSAFSGGFTYRGVKLTRDLHCLEASVTYTNELGFRNDNTIMFDIKIKGLSPSANRFGIGQFGQAVDTTMGQFNY
jgi:hypothetical protein